MIRHLSDEATRIGSTFAISGTLAAEGAVILLAHEPDLPGGAEAIRDRRRSN